MRIAFVDFWSGYEQEFGGLRTFWLLSYLKKNHQIVSIDESPDVVICSVFGTNHLKYPHPKKILFSGENIVPPSLFSRTYSLHGIKYFLSTNHSEVTPPTDAKIYYTPFGAFAYDMEVIKKKHLENMSRSKTKFCCFVSSGGGSDRRGYAIRNEFFSLVDKNYRRVDSAGRVLNNLGYYAPRGHDEYIDWVADYKFMICFENSPGAGYLTEKVFTPYAAATIPIYWGDPTNWDLIRKEACIEYTTPDDTLKRLIALDQDSAAYKRVQEESLFYDDPDKNYILSRNRLCKILEEAFE